VLKEVLEVLPDKAYEFRGQDDGRPLVAARRQGDVRKWKVQVFRSADLSHRSARDGFRLPSAS
jgi:hypothetical protein